MRRFEGIAAAPGYAIGRIFLHQDRSALQSRAPMAGEAEVQVDPGREKARLLEAISASRREVEGLAARLASSVGEKEADILRSHLALLADPEIVGVAAERIEADKVRAEAAIAGVITETAELFRSMEDDALLQARAADIEDVGRRILGALAGREKDPRGAMPEGSVVVARDLKPSDTAGLDRSRVLAFATDCGGSTSHSAILAKAMGLAAVVGLGDFASQAQDGETIVVDGVEGLVFLEPDQATLSAYEKKKAIYEAERASLKALSSKETRTRGGKRVLVAANIGSLADAERALENGAEGVGLFRTEFLFMDRDSAPSEEEQFGTYRAVLEKMAGRPVVARTLDIGGDKEVPYLGLAKEANPFLGLRAIRLCLRRPELFRAQLRALLRASAYGKLKIMFPMISCLDELEEAKATLEACKGELEAEGLGFDKGVEVGIMVEIPSAALAAEELAAECDFFSIGTNDLTQYTLAVDRMNEAIADLYNPFNPSVLRLVKMSIDAAHARGIPCAMCGELAGSPAAIPILLGYGLDEFSMSATAIPKAKRLIGEQ
jgi:phosphotransferase system enzyme I (PtsI)